MVLSAGNLDYLLELSSWEMGSNRRCGVVGRRWSTGARRGGWWQGRRGGDVGRRGLGLVPLHFVVSQVSAYLQYLECVDIFAKLNSNFNFNWVEFSITFDLSNHPPGIVVELQFQPYP